MPGELVAVAVASLARAAKCGRDDERDQSVASVASARAQCGHRDVHFTIQESGAKTNFLSLYVS